MECRRSLPADRLAKPHEPREEVAPVLDRHEQEGSKQEQEHEEGDSDGAVPPGAVTGVAAGRGGVVVWFTDPAL